jgi:hypothetical protein
MNATTSTKPRQRRPKPVRTCKLVTTAGVHVLTLNVGTETDRYFLEELPSDDGRGFSLTRLATEKEPESVTSHVNLYPASGHHGCECKGFLRHGHCKHVESLVALDKAGRLPVCHPHSDTEADRLEACWADDVLEAEADAFHAQFDAA